MSQPSLSICIVSSAHEPMDERIYFHFAKSLSKRGHRVTIICSTSLLVKSENNIEINSFDGSSLSYFKKIKKIKNQLHFYEPDVIVSQEPLTNFASFWYKIYASKKPRIIYDITEWFPSQTQFRNTKSVISKIIKSCLIAFSNLISCCFVNRFIFGETAKRFPYNLFFSFKKSIQVSYFPSSEFFASSNSTKTNHEFVLGYTGILNNERGFFHFIYAVIEFKRRNPDIKLKLLIIGFFENAYFEKLYHSILKELEGVKIEFTPKLSFLEFCHKINEIDICVDLRTLNWENNHSLPIKLFYYMACGKPVIYSEIKAIKKDVPEIYQIGKLVNPLKTLEIVQAIEDYIYDNELFTKHSQTANHLFQTKYNWKNLESAFIRFLES